MSENMQRSSFSGKVGFILATSASAVGLGNLWRFPYETSHYGGGIFVLVYVLLAFTFGVCLMMMETAIGRKTGKSCFSAFGDLCRKYRFIGYLSAIVPLMIIPYYCVIGGWVTKWFFESAIGNLSMLADNSGEYWWTFITGATDGGFLGPSFWFIIFAFMCMICVVAGVDKGIEKMSKVLMPMLFIMIIGIIGFEMTLDGFWDGVVYYLKPDISALGPDTFLGATSQIFYSMSIAMGILITYGSYTKKDVDLEKSSYLIGTVDTVVALLAGLLIIPAAFMCGFTESSGMGLMFVALPQVFTSMSSGMLIAPLFYLLVIVAALTSAVSMSETCASIFMDGVKTDRRRSISLTAIVILIFGTICVLGFENGPLAFDTMLSQNAGWLGFFDTITNSVIMPIVCILTCIFVGYVIKTKVIEDEISISSPFRIRKIFRVMVMYICPVLLSIVFIAWAYGVITG